MYKYILIISGYACALILSPTEKYVTSFGVQLSKKKYRIIQKTIVSWMWSLHINYVNDPTKQNKKKEEPTKQTNNNNIRWKFLSCKADNFRIISALFLYVSNSNIEFKIHSQHFKWTNQLIIYFSMRINTQLQKTHTLHIFLYYFLMFLEHLL